MKADSKTEIKNDNKFGGWFKSLLKNEKKNQVDLRINGEHNSVATSTANILWKTNLASTTGYVKFSTDKNLVVSSAQVNSVVSANFQHKVALTGLQPGTVYYYVIGSKDANGNVVEEKVRHFKTKKDNRIDSQLLKIMFSNTFNVDANSANVIWITNKPTSAKLWVSASSTVNTTGTPTLSFGEMSYFHNINIPNLATSTTYYYVAGGTDAAGNTVLTNSGSFTTSAR